jgi:hypothetical protein
MQCTASLSKNSSRTAFCHEKEYFVVSLITPRSSFDLDIVLASFHSVLSVFVMFDITPRWLTRFVMVMSWSYNWQTSKTWNYFFGSNIDVDFSKQVCQGN